MSETQKPLRAWRGTKVVFSQGSPPARRWRGRPAEKCSRIPSPAPQQMGSGRVSVSARSIRPKRVCSRTRRYRLFFSEKTEKPPSAQRQGAFRGKAGPGFRNVEGFHVKTEKKQKQYHKN